MRMKSRELRRSRSKMAGDMTHSWSAKASRAVNLALDSRAFEDNWPYGQGRGPRDGSLVPVLGCEGRGPQDGSLVPALGCKGRGPRGGPLVARIRVQRVRLASALQVK